ncbi:peptide ABC transporter substrate-binding protein [Pelagibius litoralis]|uniref:Peptide ABC transporter substrate-binding protein n=1 Tax=Pelagibius litoralis TaxID=374515 RepID=A0A967F2S2_9PROT|nr:peptide ABC transporter substrate-binding protein [Pelagibius litoralis]NIA71845.1 peptide ABC transporter substrate-binding protein [Pelagibius litoralis]
MLLKNFKRVALGVGLAVALTGTAQAEKVLRVGNDGEPQSMDPHYISTVQTSRISDDMTLGLLTYGQDGEPIAGAAESWTISEDGKTYTFKIRDHMWSDGTPVTAHDFVYAWQRILKPDTGAEYASLLYIIEGAEDVNTGKGGPEVLAAEAVDDKTLRVQLTAAAPYFLAQLTHQTAFPVPRHMVEKHGRDWTKPENIVVNGPYKLVNWTPNVSTELVKNDKFYDAENVAIDRVIYYSMEDRTAIQKRFRAGEIDVGRDIASEQIDWLRENMADSLRIAPYAGIYYYVFRSDTEPFNDVRVRKALSMAINREVITDKVLRTGELPAYSFVPPGTGNYGEPQYADWKGEPYGEVFEKAKGLLAEAGYGPDKPLKVTLRYNTSENHKRIAVAVQSMWKKLGVNAELFNTDGKIHYSDLKQGDFQVARAGWIADYNDAQNFLFLLETKTGPINYSKFGSEKFDGLMAEAGAVVDLGQRAKILGEAEAVAMEGQPIAPIYYYVSKQLVSPNVVGWVDNAPDRHVTRFLDLKQ